MDTCLNRELRMEAEMVQFDARNILAKKQQLLDDIHILDETAAKVSKLLAELPTSEVLIREVDDSEKAATRASYSSTPRSSFGATFVCSEPACSEEPACSDDDTAADGGKGGGAFGFGFGGDRGDDGDRGAGATTLLITFGVRSSASDANRWVRVAPLGVVTANLPPVSACQSSGTDDLEPGARPPVRCAAANRNATPKPMTWSTRAGRARRTAPRDAALIGATQTRRPR